jgi:hypothetical protein
MAAATVTPARLHERRERTALTTEPVQVLGAAVPLTLGPVGRLPAGMLALAVADLGRMLIFPVATVASCFDELVADTATKRDASEASRRTITTALLPAVAGSVAGSLPLVNIVRVTLKALAAGVRQSTQPRRAVGVDPRLLVGLRVMALRSASRLWRCRLRPLSRSRDPGRLPARTFSAEQLIAGRFGRGVPDDLYTGLEGDRQRWTPDPV